jgi:hypothetical protein
MPATLLELSYDAAIRALDLQERAVDQLRSRAGILLAASSVTASFLGGQTIQHTNELGTFGALALIALVISIGLSIYVLLPKRGFVFGLSAPRMYEELYALSVEEAQRRVIYWLEGYWAENQAKIEEIGRYYFLAAVALIAQLLFWSWALADRIS